MCPFIEVAQYDAWARDVDRPQQIFIDQTDRLCPALAVRRTEVNVEDVKEMWAYAEVGTKHTPFFPAGNAQIHMTGQFESAPAESYIAVHSAAMLASFSDGVKVSETIREIAGLMILNRETVVAHDLLQRYQIGIELCEHPSDAFDGNPAVESTSLVNVVGGNAESIHRYT
jgi:hypothetical protein